MKKLGFLLVCIFAVSFCSIGAVNVEVKSEGIRLPVIMYHAIFEDNTRLVPYSIHLKSLEADLDYLQANGYNTVLPREVLNYVNGIGALPKNPIMLTFDDGFYNNFSLALPVLSRRGMSAAFAVVGEFSENHAETNNRWGYLSFEDIKSMQKNPLVEITNHTYAMHGQTRRAGATKKYNESEECYKKAFQSDLTKLNDVLVQNGISKPIALMYPFGFMSKNSNAYAEEAGLFVTFSCREVVNQISTAESLFNLGRFNRDKCSVKQILEKIKT